MPVSRRRFLSAAVAAPAMLLPRDARAAYPERPIRLIVPFAAGGAVDSVARVLGKALSANLGGSIVIDNRGGAGGVIGMEAVAHASADGYTLLLSHSGLAAMPGLYRDLPFDPARDFAGVVTAASGAYVLAVNSAEPFTSVADLIAFAKANPGRLTYGSAGAGSIIHLAGEFFKRTAGVELVHVPYKGAAPAITDLVGGQIRMMFAPAVNALPLAAAGKLRALAVTSAKRSRLAPDLPTVAESGLPGFEVTGWYGLAAPAATAAAAVTRLNAETNRALAADEPVEQLRQQGLEPVGDTPEQASAWIRTEVAQWTRVIRDAGIKPL
ncbi:MAG TPA: tripartite tricarboxylate transporter substrate binding protein [Xanthobacteraceae bacterium]|nr:tripartite tricarboxylate transporter substrate binding protein [Xanthobacteraceae bacterium]